MIRQNMRGSGMVAVAAMLWGSVGVVAAVLLQRVALSPLMMGTLRLALAVPVVWGWHWLVQRRWRITWVHPSHQYWVVAGGVAFAVYQVAYFAAIPHIGVAAAVMLNLCSAPLFTVLLSWLVWRERLSVWAGMAVLGAVVGAAVLVMGDGTVLIRSMWGIVWALAAGLAYSVVAITSRGVTNAYATPTVLSALFAVATGVLALAVVVVEPRPWPAITGATWAGALYLALVPTVLSYRLYVGGLRSIRATTATTISLLEPLTSVALAVCFLDERLVWQSWVGATLLLFCTIWLVWSPAPAQRPDEGNDGINEQEHANARSWHGHNAEVVPPKIIETDANVTQPDP
jgi:drug/metabolite transporter, DME family